MISTFFEVHILNENGKSKARRIAAEFNALLDSLTVICPEGRELALVRTKLEEAAFFAKKAMAKNRDNQVCEIKP